ncbi:MAG: glycosyltransferase [Symbiobacteriia bacterium]
MIGFWFLVTICSVSITGTLIAAVRLALGFRTLALPRGETSSGQGLSIIVPIRGTDAHTYGNLEALITSVLPVPVEYLLAMETAGDPAYAVCTRLKQAHPDRAVQVVLTGAPVGVMGKQHNLAVAAQAAQYPIIGSMDADVQVAPDTLAIGLLALTEPGVGTAFFLPVYVGDAPIGGTLVTLYATYHYDLYMGSLALSGRVPFIFGALWLADRATIDQAGGFGQFGVTVSDDAAIGRSVHKLGLKNQLIPRTVAMPSEDLDCRGGFRQLQKWLGMLRAEGLASYLTIWLLWHPVSWSAFVLLATALGWYRVQSLGWAVLLFLTAVAAELAACYLLNRRVFAFPAWRHAIRLILYELLLVQPLFVSGLFRRTIEWKGRRYRLGRGGRIQAMIDVPPRGRAASG